MQRIYGQTPFVLVGNSHCQPCVGCAKNCYDFNPKAAYLADLNDEDPLLGGYRKLFVGAFPGLVLAFFTVPDRPPRSASRRCSARFALYMLVSVGSFLAARDVLQGHDAQADHALRRARASTSSTGTRAPISCAAI